MTKGAEEVEKLRRLCRGAELWDEGGQEIVFLPDLRFESSSGRREMDALLWPAPRDGYESRLFLSEAIPARAGHNGAANIKGRPWYAVSWRGVSASLPWVEVLANHLRAYR